MKALVGAFNQEKALVRAFSVIVKTDCDTDGALHSIRNVTTRRRTADTSHELRNNSADELRQPGSRVREISSQD